MTMLNFKIDNDGNNLLVSFLTNRLDYSTLEDFKECLHNLLINIPINVKKIIIKLDNVSTIATCHLVSLLKLNKEAKDKRIYLTIITNPRSKSVFELTRLDNYFTLI